MSFTKSKSRHAMASVRKVSLNSDGTPIKLPPLHTDNAGSSLQNGLQGNAMAIPPAKMSPEPRRSSREDVNVSTSVF